MSTVPGSTAPGSLAEGRTRVLFVGAFPPANSDIVGGNVTDCRILLQSSFATRLELDLVDSTQISNPPPSLPVRLVLASRRLVRYAIRFEAGRPQVLLLFTSGGASVLEKGAMAWYARLRGVPAVMFPRGGRLLERCERSRFRRLWVRASFRGARKVFCQSVKWQEFAETVLGIPKRDAPVIPSWTATERLLSIGRDRTFGPRDPVRLLYLGWLEREKGVEELLTAVGLLSPDADFTLDIVGDGSYADAARNAVPAEIADRVRFRGWLQGEAVESVLADSDVLVLPSWAEGLPNAMIEAMAAGLAVVTTPVGGIPDHISDGREGLLVPPRDANLLALALGRIVGDDELRKRLALAGHALAARRFSSERAADRMVGELERLASSAGRQVPRQCD